MFLFEDEPKRKRTLGIRDKQILHLRANEKCENPGCPDKGKRLRFSAMHVGHKKAYSKGGSTKLSNLVSLCAECNKLQGTDSWAVFLKKQNVVEPAKEKKETVKERLRALTITQLKSLATKHGITVKGSVKEDWFETRKIPPTKTQYVNRLSTSLKLTDLKSIPKTTPKKSKAKPKKKKKSDDWWNW